MEKARRGRKLTCHNCGVKYYDMKKKDVRCPECDAEYKEEKIKPRRGMRTDKPKPTPEKTIKSRKEKSQSVHSNELEKVILQVTSTKTFLKRQEPKDAFKTTPAKINLSDNIKNVYNRKCQ